MTIKADPLERHFYCRFTEVEMKTIAKVLDNEQLGMQLVMRDAMPRDKFEELVESWRNIRFMSEQLHKSLTALKENRI